MKKQILLLAIMAMAYKGYAQCDSNKLVFKNPVRVLGSGYNVNAVYKFTGVKTGVDAFVTILENFDAVIDNMDNTSGGYANAWQPNIKTTSRITAKRDSAYVQVRVDFKNTNGTTRTLGCISSTVVDCDGVADYSERLQFGLPCTFSVVPHSQITALKSGTFNFTGTNYTYNNIDTLNPDVMTQVNYGAVSSITIKIGLVRSNNNGDIPNGTVRQNCLFFKTFPSLNVILSEHIIQFEASAGKKQNNILVWCEGYDSAQLIRDGRIIKTITGAGAVEITDRDYASESVYQLYVWVEGRRYKSREIVVANELWKPHVIKRTDLWLHPVSEGYQGCVIEFLDNGTVRKGVQE